MPAELERHFGFRLQGTRPCIGFDWLHNPSKMWQRTLRLRQALSTDSRLDHLKDNDVTNIQHRPLRVSPFDTGDNQQAPGLIIGVVGTPLSNDQKAADTEGGPNTSATAVESTDDHMIHVRTQNRAPIRLSQTVNGAADRYLTTARPFIETPNRTLLFSFHSGLVQQDSCGGSCLS